MTEIDTIHGSIKFTLCLMERGMVSKPPLVFYIDTAIFRPPGTWLLDASPRPGFPGAGIRPFASRSKFIPLNLFSEIRDGPGLRN